MHRRRHVTWRIAKMPRHLVRPHVPEELLGARARLGLTLGGIEQRRVGEPVDRHLVAAANVAPALAVGGVDRRRAAISGEERRLHIAARADARGAARRGRRYPDGRMRLLVRARPNVDVAVVKEPPFMADRAIVAGPGLDDEVYGLPLPLVHARGIAVRRQPLIGHPAHETAFETPFR